MKQKRSPLETPTAELLALDLPRVHRTLISWTEQETKRTGLSRLVVGLSGGIDSALAAAIGAEAVGPENFLAVSMPHRISSPESLADAKEVARHIGVPLEEREITGMVDGYLDTLEKEISPQRIGNIQARVRMAILYDISARDGALVLGTSNKTELLLGYSTLWGDNAYALNPIGDLYKTQVYTLAEEVGLPERVIRKAPSADLWEGQTDEEELGFTYAEVDRALFLMVDLRYRVEDLVEMGFDEPFVERVRKMIVGSQFKRRPPIWPKISPRTVGLDFRYARDWET
jgi:NAD+ synthase